MIKSLLLLLGFVTIYADVLAQNIQGSLRFGSSNEDIIITIKNNGAAPYIGNLTSFDVTARLYEPGFRPREMKYMFSDDAVTYNHYTNFTLPFYHFYWTGNFAINLAPGATFDLVGFKMWLPYPLNGAPELFTGSVDLVAGEYLNHPWSVKFDGVEAADPNNRFFDSGVPNAFLVNDPFGSEYRILADLVLPVQLAQFKVLSKENAVTLKWTTTEEINSSKFEIQHSKDAKNWKNIGAVAAIGESSVTQHYSFSHHAASAGHNYYRLKMVDMDLTYAYSRIEVVDMESGSNAIYPNPVASQFEVLDLDTRNVSSINIYNTSGKLVGQARSVNGLISVEHISSGRYIAIIHKLDGSSESHKFVKK